jgi:L-threonylcarbamoyladenylate synthase
MSIPTEREYNQAVERIVAGELVAFPTETVYGLGGDAANPQAIQKIFNLKGRPADHPLIAHVSSIEQAKVLSAHWTDEADALAHTFWPGPLTLIVKKAAHVPDALTGGQDSVGLRLPNHPVAIALIQRCERALAAPSANRFGHVSPTQAQHVLDEFGNSDLQVLDGGVCSVGIESTIVSLLDNPLLLRPGQLSLEQLQALLPTLRLAHKAEGPRASGRLLMHYAPMARCLRFKRHECVAIPSADAVIAFYDRPKTHQGLWIQAPLSPTEYAQHLYQWLRECDARRPSTIWIEEILDKPEWMGVADRVNRASIQSRAP